MGGAYREGTIKMVGYRSLLSIPTDRNVADKKQYDEASLRSTPLVVGLRGIACATVPRRFRSANEQTELLRLGSWRSLDW